MGITTDGRQNGLYLDESITLLEVPEGGFVEGGHYEFLINNYDKLPTLTQRLDDEATGFTTMVAKTEPVRGENKIRLTVSEKYLYGEGGTNSPGQREKGNTLNITDGVKANAAFGGRATTGDVTGNKVAMSGGEIVEGSSGGSSFNPYTGNLYGGLAEKGDVAGNEVTVSGGTLGRFTYVFGGRSEQGAAGGTDPKDGNKVTITGGTVGTVQGGYSLGDASYNSVEIAGGTVLGDAYGGESSQGNALNNSVTVKEGTAGWVFGGHTQLTGMKAAGNKVTITGGVVQNVYGGWVDDKDENGDSVGGSPNPASATENTVEIRGGTVNGYVYGGQSALGPAERNTVILAKEGKEAPNLDNAILCGGFGGSVSDNTLQVEAAGLSARAIYNFDNYKFVLPSDIKAGDTMLKLKGQGEDLTINADYVNLAVFNNAAPGMALLGERITLVEKAGGNGTFGVDGLKTGGEGIYPLWLDGQEGIEVADYSLTADSIRLDMKLEGLYLYGEGGTNPTPGQRKSNNILTVSAGTKATAAFGGRVNIGDVTGNKVTMSGGELVTTDVTHPNYGLSGNVYGGLAEDGAATGNRVTLEGGTLRAAYGGFSFAGTVGGEGEGLGNSVTVRGGQVAEGVYGGYAVQKDAAANLVAVSGGTVSGAVVGGYAEIGNAIKNTVTLEGKGNINGNVTAGQSEKGEVRANTITAKGGLVAGSLFGGRSESGEVRDNTLRVSGGTIEGSLTAGQSGSGEVRANTLTVEGGEIKGRLTLGQVSGTLTGGLSSKGGSVKNAVTLSGGIFTGAVSVTGGSSPVKAADNVVNLTGTTKGLEGATLRGYSDAKAAHSGNELHVGGVKEYDASGNATITKATWQGTASASNGTGTLLRTAALRNTAGASGGTAQQGAAGSGTNGNRVDTVANFDSIALHNVVWGSTPALSAKTIENIGGLDVTGLEFFTHPNNSTVHEHALQDSMVLLRADNNELTGMEITYLDEGNVKTEALTGQGINYHKAAHHSEENGVTVDGIEKKRIYLADHNQSVDFLYHVDGEKITLGDVKFVKGDTARFLDGRFDVRNAEIDADGFNMTDASMKGVEAGEAMTVVDAKDAIKAKGATATLKAFTGEGVTGGVKKYDVAFSDDVTANLNLSGIHTDTLSQNAEKTKLTYTVGEKNVSEATMTGELAWQDGGIHYTNTSYNFNTDAKTDLGGLTIGKVTADPTGQSMTLIGGKAAGTVENAPASFGVSLDKTNTTLDATAKGAAAVANGDVTYAVTGVTLDKVTVNQVTAGTDSVPKGWAIASGLEIDTDTMQLPTGTANSEYAILTAGSGSFAGAKVTGQYAYASHSPFTLENGGVAVAGEKKGGVKLSDDNKAVEYHVVQDHVKNVRLGLVEFAKDKTLLTVGGEYEFTKVNAINTTDFAMKYMKPETVAANDSMTLLQGNSTLQANALLANMAADVKTKNYSYSFEPVAGVNVAAKITGSLGTTAKGDGFTYTVNEHRADKLTFGSVEWKHSGALLKRPDNIIFAGAAVDTTKIHFHNVDSLQTDHHMTLVSDFGNKVGEITGDHYTVGASLQGKGTASLKGSDLVYTIEHGTNQDTEAQPQTHNTVMGMTAGISLLASGAEQISQAMAGLNLMDSFGGMNTAGGAATGTTGTGGTGGESGTGQAGSTEGSEASGQGQDGTGSENTGGENNGSDPAKGEEGQKDENGQGSGKGSGGRDDEQKETDAEGIIIASIGGSKDRVETGSHVTSHNWNGVLGIGGKRMMKSGTLQYAAFAEHGRSNFTLHSENGRGSGNSRYTGGGLIAKWQNRHNVYMEASIRAGRMHDTASNMLHDPLTGQGYGYDVRANYIGGHVGIGKVYYYANGRSLDVYGRFFHMKRDGVSFDAGGHFDLDSVKSSVLRVGARYGATDKLWNWYGGLAYEYEFDGKSTGTADGAPIRSASMSGGSVRGEIGLRMNSSKTNPWKADISLTAHAGKHRGFGGNVSVAYTF
ncbi:MAG: autotransporter outer membrane beta-barrel domain-containing protein [Succiniclasticum sp.]|uniref:autotransporter outer membrane beta-barrel domain-containing protein n=1 Tax=Succiniclasticum sp. TaxID=2775030 RepID=UPI002A91D7D0|nr:autotransporter outer membrane beta-barrel domain-containing protein [Succiniclasticum sp.]MDY6292160.1 autotransporter outer membrane beta-barrel domain-containing protein [Succiniclasticum sp.]